MHLVEHVIDTGLRFQFLRTEPRPRRRPTLLLATQVDHPVILLRFECYEVEMQPVSDSVDVFVGQRVLPTGVAEHRGEVAGDMLPHPKQRRKAILAAGKRYDDFHLSALFSRSSVMRTYSGFSS